VPSNKITISLMWSLYYYKWLMMVLNCLK